MSRSCLWLMHELLQGLKKLKTAFLFFFFFSFFSFFSFILYLFCSLDYFFIYFYFFCVCFSLILYETRLKSKPLFFSDAFVSSALCWIWVTFGDCVCVWKESQRLCDLDHKKVPFKVLFGLGENMVGYRYEVSRTVANTVKFW